MRAERVRADVEAPLAALGLLVEEVTVTAAGRRSVVRIAVDRDLAELAADDGTSRVAPLSLDDVAEATRAVSAALDADPRLGEAPYVLEVSSPGVDRPLTLPRHLRRNVGRLVRLTCADGAVVAGRIRAVDVDEVHLDADPAVGAGGRVLLTELRIGRVVIEFGRSDELADDELADDELADDELADVDLEEGEP
jgi:ribosome maturation factor RimP